MKSEDFRKEIELVEKLPVNEQINFYARVLNEEKEKTEVRLLAYFSLSYVYYTQGKFRKAINVVEPVIIDYEQYPYIPEMISIFNLIGICSHSEGEYRIARTFYRTAMTIAREQNEKSRYANEYNNIALAYIAEKNYKKGLEYIRLAEKYLSMSFKDMGAYVYLNYTEIETHIGNYDDALMHLNKSIQEYDANTYIANDVLFASASLYFARGEKEAYQNYRDLILKNLDTMIPSEVIDGLTTVFECSLKENNLSLAKEMVLRMDDYMVKHPLDYKVGLRVEEARYSYAKVIQDPQLIEKALLKRSAYYGSILEATEDQRAEEVANYRKFNRQLMKAVDSEARANRVKTQFLANMSHDIRTPINGITGMLQMIERFRDNQKLVDDCLEKIDFSTKHLLSLVNDVLDMTKLETDAVVLEHKPFSVFELCQESMQMVKFQAEADGLHVFSEMDSDCDVSVIGSPVHLQKILINLFGNAIKYNKKNGEIHTSVKKISENDKYVTFAFSIWDTGVGMSKDFIENSLFEPFVQQSNTSRSKYGGTGLGMSIVGQLVKKMNGKIEVHSQLGVGSSFCVTIPFEIDHLQHVTKKVEKKKCNLKGKHILVVEDNEVNVEIAKFMLEDEKAVVDVAQNGKEAVDKYLSNTYDAILMDLMMPVMDGYTATKIIRDSKKEDALTIPIIAMSANAYIEDVNHCLECGMNAHISKPIFKDSFLKTLSKYM